MAFVLDVERVPVVGAEAHARRRRQSEERREGVQVFGHASFADPDGDAVSELFLCLGEFGALVGGRRPLTD